jgi:hypothetical protein
MAKRLSLAASVSSSGLLNRLRFEGLRALKRASSPLRSIASSAPSSAGKRFNRFRFFFLTVQFCPSFLTGTFFSASASSTAGELFNRVPRAFALGTSFFAIPSASSCLPIASSRVVAADVARHFGGAAFAGAAPGAFVFDLVVAGAAFAGAAPGACVFDLAVAGATFAGAASGAFCF